MLPNREIDLLVTDVLNSIDLAVTGQVPQGFRKLVTGLRRAEMQQTAGAWWGAALVARYREALDNYTARYGPPVMLCDEPAALSEVAPASDEWYLALDAA